MRIEKQVINMHNIYNHNAPKKPTNLSINSDLLVKAKDLKINLSAALETALEAKVRLSAREKWLKENKKALASLNELAENNGLFSDSYRDL
jgi:antitoxin CcdA